MASASRANCSMSKRYPASRSSGCIKNLPCRQDLVPPKRISQGRLLDEVDFSPEQRFDLIFQVKQIPQIPAGVRLEHDEQIDVAVAAEIVPQHGSEER